MFTREMLHSPFLKTSRRCGARGSSQRKLLRREGMGPGSSSSTFFFSSSPSSPSSASFFHPLHPTRRHRKQDRPTALSSSSAVGAPSLLGLSPPVFLQSLAVAMMFGGDFLDVTSSAAAAVRVMRCSSSSAASCGGCLVLMRGLVGWLGCAGAV